MRRSLLIATAALVAGCSVSAAPRSSGEHPLRVSVAQGCPHALGGHDGVRNSGSGLDGRLVPGTPAALLICRYSPVGGVQVPSEVHGALYASRRLGPTDAVTFAHLLNAIPRDTGEHTCPADLSRYDVLAFALRGRADVDVWSSSTGCWSFSNGSRRSGAPSAALEAYMQRLDSAVPGETDVRAGANGARGTVRGRLLASGGPPGPPHPLPGKVSVQPGGAEQVVVGNNGTFAVTVAPGTYTLTGRSPLYNGGRVLCRADAPVQVVAGQTVTADVYCIEK